MKNNYEVLYLLEKVNDTTYSNILYNYIKWLKTGNSKESKYYKDKTKMLLKEIGLSWDEWLNFQDVEDKVVVYYETEQGSFSETYNNFRYEKSIYSDNDFCDESHVYYWNYEKIGF